MFDEFSTFQSVINTQHSETDTFARFYDRSVKTGEINPKTGLPIFKNVCYVEIRIKNNNTDIYDQPATPEKIARFPEAYRRYETTKKQVRDGSPLEHFSFLTAAQIDTLKCHGICTVERLASLPFEKAQDLDVTSEKEAAEKFLSSARKNCSQIEWQTKFDTLQKQIEALTRENKQLRERLQTTSAHRTSNKSRPMGRKSK